MSTVQTRGALGSPPKSPATEGDFVVRCALPSDVAELFETVGTTVEGLYPCGREKLIARLFANISLGDGSFVVSIGERVVAYAAEVVKPNGRVKISTFWVREDFRRRGIGRALMDFLVARWDATEPSSVYVTVRYGKEVELLYLFQKYGFSQVALEKDRYGHGKHEVVLEAELDSLRERERSTLSNNELTH